MSVAAGGPAAPSSVHSHRRSPRPCPPCKGGPRHMGLPEGEGLHWGSRGSWGLEELEAGNGTGGVNGKGVPGEAPLRRGRGRYCLPHPLAPLSLPGDPGPQDLAICPALLSPPRPRSPQPWLLPAPTFAPSGVLLALRINSRSKSASRSCPSVLQSSLPTAWLWPSPCGPDHTPLTLGLSFPPRDLPRKSLSLALHDPLRGGQGAASVCSRWGGSKAGSSPFAALPQFTAALTSPQSLQAAASGLEPITPSTLDSCPLTPSLEARGPGELCARRVFEGVGSGPQTGRRSGTQRTERKVATLSAPPTLGWTDWAG